MKAPTRKVVRNLEKQKEDMLSKRNEEAKQTEQKEVEEADKINASRIIKQLSKMFQNGEVSSLKGCSICKIPWEICTDGVLVMINKYLDGEWLAKFENNTGNTHDFEMTNTLWVKPCI